MTQETHTHTHKKRTPVRRAPSVYYRLAVTTFSNLFFLNPVLLLCMCAVRARELGRRSSAGHVLWLCMIRPFICYRHTNKTIAALGEFASFIREKLFAVCSPRRWINKWAFRWFGQREKMCVCFAVLLSSPMDGEFSYCVFFFAIHSRRTLLLRDVNLRWESVL